MKKKQLAIILMLACSLIACSVVTEKPTQRLQSKAQIKNVIMVIGDGMGPQQVGLLLSYARQAPQSIIQNRITAFDRLMETGQLGISLTHAAGVLVTDSAASATQLATGTVAGSEMIGIDQHGNVQENIITKAKQLGKATGLVSDTRITHATPAAFAAHQTHRDLESEIAEDLLNTEPDVMFSAGLSYWLPAEINGNEQAIQAQLSAFNGLSLPIESKRKDNKNLLTKALDKGYKLLFNKQQLLAVQGKSIGLFANRAMQNAIIEHQQAPQNKQPTLKEMSQQALSILEKNDRGFFLMIEAGQIDWAAHRNDTGLLLHEMLRMNETLNYVLDWMGDRQDTLLIVTADHETGGFGFSYSAVDMPKSQYLAGQAFADKTVFQPAFNFGNPEILDRLYRQKCSYHALFTQFDTLPEAQRTATKLAEIVNVNTEFPITQAQAERILSTEKNPYYAPTHKTLKLTTVPKMPVNGAFFPYQAENRENLLAQAVSEQQQAVWSTGTHTSTPVYVFTLGAKQALPPFHKMTHHSEIGKLAIDALYNRNVQ